MKKNLKCLTALCMAGAMISLTGCGSSSQSTSADTTAGSATSEATTSAESTASGNGSKTVIEYWQVPTLGISVLPMNVIYSPRS